MPTTRANTAVDPSQIADMFNPIAKALAPPTAQEIYAGAKSRQVQQQVQYTNDLYDYAASQGMDQRLLDNRLSVIGTQNGGSSLTAVGMNNANALRTNAADNARALQQTGLQQAGETERALLNPVGESQTRFVPPSIASRYQLPAQQVGVVKANEGQVAALPGGGTVEGRQKPLNMSEMEAAVFGRQDPAFQRSVVGKGVGYTNVIKPDGGGVEVVPNDQAAGRTPAPPDVAPSNVGRLQAERAKLPAGDPRIAEYDAAIAAEGRGATADPYRNSTDQALAKRHAEIVASGEQASGMLANLDRLTALSQAVPQGALAQRRVDIAKYAHDLGLPEVASGLTGGKLDEATAFNAIVQRMAPALRTPGSGAQSDRELKNFLDSLPSLTNTPGGNKLIMETLRGAAQRQQQAANIARRAQDGSLDKFEADRQIAALPSPFAQFVPAEGPAAPGVPARNAPAGAGAGAGGPVRVTSPAEARKLPSGTPVLLPDGSEGVVP